MSEGLAACQFMCGPIRTGPIRPKNMRDFSRKFVHDDSAHPLSAKPVNRRVGYRKESDQSGTVRNQAGLSPGALER